MFFDRSSSRSHPSVPDSSTQPNTQSHARRRSRRVTALGLAVAMATPTAALVARLSAAEPPAPASEPAAPLTAAQTMQLGARLLDQRQYEQAQVTFGKVRTVDLTGAQHTEFTKLKVDLTKALAQRHLALEQYRQAIELQRAGRLVEARSLFQTVVNNHFADPDTARMAKMAVSVTATSDVQRVLTAVTDAPAADDSAKNADTIGAKEHFKRGVDQYRSGDWISARKNFEAARGYKPSLFEGDRPEIYLGRMDKKENADRDLVRSAQASARNVNAGADPQPAGTAAQPDTQAMDVLRGQTKTDDLRRQQNAFQAGELVKQAGAAIDAGDVKSARDKFAEAVRLDPTNAQAQAGLDDTSTRLGLNTAKNSPLEQQAANVTTRAQEIIYRFDSAINDAKAAIRDQKFDAANLAIKQAQFAAGADRSIFSQDKLNYFDRTLASAQIDYDRTLATAREAASQLKTTETSDILTATVKRTEAERLRTINDLKSSAKALTEKGRYKEALGIIDQILVIEPADEYAVGVRPLLEDKTVFQRQRNYAESKITNFELQMVDAEEKKIPYNDILRYPSDWPDISTTRDQTVAAERGDTQGDRAIQAQLDKSLPELNFEGVGFGDVIEFLRDVSGANIVVNWKALEASSIDRTAPVTLKLRNVKFSKALDLILSNVGGSTVTLGYTIDEGVIVVSTGEELAKNTVTKVYDIRDLIINIPDFTDAPSFDLTSLSNQGNQGGQGGSQGGVGGGGGSSSGSSGSSQGLFGANGSQNQQNNGQNAGPQRQELVDSVTTLIKDTVAPNSWEAGTGASLRELQGSLIVSQTTENQHKLMSLLEQLREQRAIQVTVETRFLTIQRNFLEDVGLDLNFIFNLNGSWSNKFSQIPLTTPSSSYTAGPTTSVPGSIGTSASSLTTSATFLDDFQVTMLLRATQAQQTSTIVQAPRVTLYNGQRAFVLVAVQQAYVSNLTAAVGTGVSAFQPTVSNIQSGVLLDVVATVSADRKYVTLTLRPQLANLLDLKSFTFQNGTTAAAPAVPIVGGGTVTTAAAAPTGTIQQPELQITQVKTTVTVPDGGTLLLGGQTIAGELEKEVGVPVLSKIPFLKRLFTNRSMAKDEQVLLILVKPTIIITREIEQKQFPLLSSKLGS